MKIIADKNEMTNFLHHLCYGLLRDPLSWKDWYLLAVSATPAFVNAQQGKVIGTICAELDLADGAVLWLDHGTCIAVFQHPGNLENIKILDKLHETHLEPEVRLISLRHNAREAFIVASNQISSVEAEPDASEPPAPNLILSVPNLKELMNSMPAMGRTRKDRTTSIALVVEDDQLTRHIISRSLKEEHILMTANNAIEAIHMHHMYQPDVIFLDIDLPDYDGFALLNHIRVHDPACRVVMFSNNSGLSNRLKAFGAGARGFIAKPFNKDAFKHYIDKSEGKIHFGVSNQGQ